MRDPRNEVDAVLRFLCEVRSTFWEGIKTKVTQIYEDEFQPNYIPFNVIRELLNLRKLKTTFARADDWFTDFCWSFTRELIIQ